MGAVLRPALGEGRWRRASPAWGMRKLRTRNDASSRGGVDNEAMGREGRAAADAAAALARSARRRARAITAAPRWPLVSALLLGLVALVETLIRAGSPTESDASTALLLNLLATVPLALRRRRLPAVAAVVTLATIVVVSG